MDFRETMKRVQNYIERDDLRNALAFSRFAIDAAENEEELVEVHELQHELRVELGIVRPDVEEVDEETEDTDG